MTEAATSVGNMSPIAQLFTEWRHTAEVHADPKLYALLSAPRPIDRVGMAGEWFAEGFTAGHIPQPDAAIDTGDGQQLAIGAECHAPDRIRVAGQLVGAVQRSG